MRFVIVLLGSAAAGLGGENGAPVRASAKLSAAISAGLPRFALTPIEVPLHEESSDRIALAPFIVEGSRIPKIPEQDLLTKAGMELLLRDLYPGASVRGQNPTMNGSVPNYAALMYRDDLRLKQMAEFDRVINAIAIGGDLAGAKELKAEMQEIFVRPHDWRTEGMDKSVNRWRR